MTTKREELEAWIRDHVQLRYPELVEPLLQAADAFDRLRDARRARSDDLARVIEAASSPRSPLGENAATMLGELATAIPKAREAIAEMSRARELHVRINALVALASFDVDEIHKEIGKQLLRDRSAGVRDLAADKMSQWRLRSLIPELEAAIDRERKPSLKKSLVFHRDLLRDGFHVRKTSDQELWVTFRNAEGVLVSRQVSTAEWQSRGPAGIARMLGVDHTSTGTGRDE